MNPQRSFATLQLAWVALIATCGIAVSAAEKEAVKQPVSRVTDFATARKHWSYQPILLPPTPKNGVSARVLSPVDAFILQKLAAKGLSFSPPADRRTLVRRVYLDLIGLPPTYEQIEAFAKDKSKDAVARLVDRLLESPRYGERWGRHWLDVARYSETKDLVLAYGKDRLRPYAYTYRDYVIRAFNEDLPYDQFIQDQLAADQVQPPVAPWRLAAMGFLTLGRLFDNDPNDQYDDQVDTVSRGLLGLTVACARCHDHKYDAIPTADYYSLRGVFASSERPYDLPLIEDPQSVPGGLEFEKQLAEARKNLEQHLDAEYVKLSEIARQRVGDYLVRVATTKPDLAETASFYLSLSAEDLRPSIVLRWRRFIEQRRKPDDPVFGLWAKLMELPEEGFEAQARQVLEKPVGAVPRLNPLVSQELQRAALTNKAEVARTYGRLLDGVYQRSKRTTGPAPPPDLARDEQELLDLVIGKESPAYFPRSEAHHQMSRPEKDKFETLVSQLDKVAANATNAPPRRAMVLTDAEELYQPRIFIRGSPARPGTPVPRAFLQVLSSEPRRPFEHGSGRLDLARAITAPDNPLTARVIVNRVWMHHFGEPLVQSASDFGMRSEPPSHPELLDYLAWTLQHKGWSLKELHRLIMNSAVYQQAAASAATPTLAAAIRRTSAQDPDNKLLWHFPRQRLDFETMRDSLLSVSGRLDLSLGGPPADVAGDPLNCRRTVYGLVDRQDLPAVFRAFDVACPDQTIEKRPRTTSPQQALFAMNSAFILTQANALAARSLANTKQDSRARVNALYRLALGRSSEKDESGRALAFVQDAEAASPAKPELKIGAWEQLAQALLMSNEFIFAE